MPLSQSETAASESDVFSGLPGTEESIPEDTELVYVTNSENTEKESNLIGSSLALVSGILLFLTSVFVGIFFRERNEKEKKKKTGEK